MRSPFANRSAWDLAETSEALAIREARRHSTRLIDLTVSNPTRCGFDYSQILSQPAQALTYDPNPFGLLPARQAIARYYTDHSASVDPDCILLTSSTSEAYFFLFRLLCNVDDQVLAAQPSYPLFDFLAGIADVTLRTYPLFYDFGWSIDLAELERRITPQTRAILLVHPNNPTGHATSPSERAQLESLCQQHNLTLIVDEVFLDYPLTAPIASFAVGPHPVLTFVVSGLSKIAALPQVKIAWLAAFGPESPVREALDRLELIADTFLSVNTPSQIATLYWLAQRHHIQEQVLARVRANYHVATESGLTVLSLNGGWSAIVRLPNTRPMEAFAQDLLAAQGVIVQPGRAFGIAEPNRIILSLLGAPEQFAEGIRALQNFSLR